jgi:hypothetical protein
LIREFPNGKTHPGVEPGYRAYDSYALEQTWGSKTFQYPEEKKMKANSFSSGERKRKSPNSIVAFVTIGSCKGMTSGVFRVHWNTFEGEYLDEVWLEEAPWKGAPKRVIAP